MERVKFILMTKSSKYGGYCVAGLDVEQRRWVRLVSGDAGLHGALTDADMVTQPRVPCRPLDLVEAPVLGPAPTERQPENVLIDRGKRWRLIARCRPEQAFAYMPPRERRVIFGNRQRLLAGDRGNIRSLDLIAVNDLELRRDTRCRCDFTFGGSVYTSISATDPDFYDVPTPYRLPRAVLAMSLADEPYNGKYFKFAAKIFPIQRDSGGGRR